MVYKSIVLACCWLLLSVGLASDDFTEAGSRPVLKVNTSIKPPFSSEDETGFFDLLVRELGKRIGCEVELVRLPPARALEFANEGVSDAELPRIAGMEKKYPNLVRVDEKVLDYNFVAFVRNVVLSDLSCWEDLEGKRVGYLIGWKIFENSVPEEAHVTKLCKPHLLFEMLDKGRIDVALYERYAGWNNILTHGHMGIHECSKPLAVKPMFMYFHNAHADLVPLATKALREMKADGTYDRIKDETLGQ